MRLKKQGALPMKKALPLIIATCIALPLSAFGDGSPYQITFNSTIPMSKLVSPYNVLTVTQPQSNQVVVKINYKGPYTLLENKIYPLFTIQSKPQSQSYQVALVNNTMLKGYTPFSNAGHYYLNNLQWRVSGGNRLGFNVMYTTDPSQPTLQASCSQQNHKSYTTLSCNISSSSERGAF